MQERDSPPIATADATPTQAPALDRPRHGRALLTHTAMQRHEWLRKVIGAADKTKTVGPAMSPGYRRTAQDEIVSFAFSVGGIPPDAKPEGVAELLRQVYDALPWPELPAVKVMPPAEEPAEDAFAKSRVYRAEFWW